MTHGLRPGSGLARRVLASRVRATTPGCWEQGDAAADQDVPAEAALSFGPFVVLLGEHDADQAES
jgi:hypothetical protein